MLSTPVVPAEPCTLHTGDCVVSADSADRSGHRSPSEAVQRTCASGLCSTGPGPPHPSCRMRLIAIPAAAVRVSTPSFANTRSRCFFTVRRAGAEDVADVAVGLALDHPVQHLGLARGELEGDRLIASITAASDTSRMHDQPLVVVVRSAGAGGRSSRRAPRSAVSGGGSICARASAGARAATPARPAAPRRAGCRSSAMQQLARQRRLPHQLAVGARAP